jgi:hypothetical protein
MKSRVLLWLLASIALNSSAFAAAGSPIAEAAIPHIRAGLWEYAWGATGLTRHRLYCEAGGPVMHRGGGTCTNVIYQRGPNGALIMDMDCAMEGSRFHLHKVVVGDLQTAFSTDGETWELPKPLIGGVITEHTSQRYLGRCPGGMPIRSFN